MSLSRYLQDPQTLSKVSDLSPQKLRQHIFERGNHWYSRHPEIDRHIGDNLSRFSMNNVRQTIDAVKQHLLLHYYEKLLPLCGGPGFFGDFIEKSVETDDASLLSDPALDEKGILIVTGHFGAIEFIVPTLARLGHTINVVLRFTTEQFSREAHARAKALTESGLFGRISFIEIGKPQTNAALDMAAVLRRKEILLTVIDEKTPYSKPVELFGTKVWGGAGIDRLVMFSRAPMAIVSAMMIREPENRYRLSLKDIPVDRANILQLIYDNLQSTISEHPEQWYFLHEDIPFVEQSA
ncbi:MAG: hypothetical protein ACOC4C_05135 [Fibrobacterota bacterium]